jgi:hypothetical protein
MMLVEYVERYQVKVRCNRSIQNSVPLDNAKRSSAVGLSFIGDDASSQRLSRQGR